MIETLEEIIEEIPSEEEKNKKDIIRRLYVGFANRSKIENLRIFIV